jgi:hypothetical protein
LKIEKGALAALNSQFSILNPQFKRGAAARHHPS